MGYKIVQVCGFSVVAFLSLLATSSSTIPDDRDVVRVPSETVFEVVREITSIASNALADFNSDAIGETGNDEVRISQEEFRRVSPPILPNHFEKLFMEFTMYPGIGRHSTFGEYIYDWTNKKSIVLRMNGKYDRLCGINGILGLTDTPCAHINTGGRLYLVYPKLQSCCFCCDADHGCRIPKPDCLHQSKFLKEFNFTMPHQKSLVVDTWLKMGSHTFIYADDATTSEPIALYEVPHILMLFKHCSETQDIVYGDMDEQEQLHGSEMCKLVEDMKKIADGVVPSWCDLNSPCSNVSTCATIQNGQLEYEDSTSMNKLDHSLSDNVKDSSDDFSDDESTNESDYDQTNKMAMDM